MTVIIAPHEVPHEAPRRQTVQARFADGRIFEGPIGTTIETFVNAANLSLDSPGMAVLMNGKLRELCLPLTEDADLEILTMTSSDGTRIYRRSLCFLLIAAAAEVLPDQVITIHHSMPFGGYYCERDDGRCLSDEELDALRRRMRELVETDLPVNQVRVPLEEALRLFREQGDQEKVDLFARRRKGYLTLYELNGVRDYFHGFMVPRTSYLEWFDLRHYKNGFILHFPRRHIPNELQPFEDEPRLVQVFQEYNEWLNILGVANVTSLNQAIHSRRVQEIVLVAEALHEKQLANIADRISAQRPHVKLVLISGPTSAGKTTFSRRLALQLMASGIFPVALSMDDYFVNREDTPRDEVGDYDFEAIEAVDVLLFRQHIKSLLANEIITLPRYNFHTSRREAGEPLGIGPEHVILVEGIHGLNPLLVEGIPPEAAYRIFISAFTQLNLDKHNRVPTTDTRLLRRIVRDAARRGYTAAQTISRWSSVRHGEKQYIFPYQDQADIFFNSALVYELSLLKTLAQPLLLQVESGTPERIEANRLLAFLQWFEPIPAEDVALIASDSILREFIGGSIMETFAPWHRLAT